MSDESSQMRVVVITGAGSGLGRELAAAFAKTPGMRVVGLGRNADKLAETAKAIDSEQFTYRSLDVSDFDAVSRAVEEILREHRRIDIVFNNAAVYQKVSFLEESAEDWAKSVAINLGGVANMCKAVLPGMIAQNFGRIYNVGSWAHMGPIEDSAAYSTTKGGVHVLTKAIATDIARLGKDVQVHEWIPGHMKTQMSGFTGIDPALAAQWGLEIATRVHASSANCVFQNNQEWQPPKSLARRIRDKLLLRR